MNPPAPRSRELPTDRLATTDRDGRRIWLYPADSKGRYRRLRTWISAALLLFFLALPWWRIGGEQALLLDVVHRRLAFFGLRFWAHDAPLLFLVAGSAAATLAFVTAVWGRVWCGYACPQTVFVDQVYRRIERWIEGDAVERRRLDAAPADGAKIAKKTLKWTLFGAIALVLSHTLLAVLAGSGHVLEMMREPPGENPGSFLVAFGLAGYLALHFGWFREQFCVVVCPYGRFQSVLMDERSQAIAYDATRGEPRRGVADGSGDCVNCYRCVEVCPTGIDIRRGLQMECVACSACVDACDDVMTRLKKPTGLIRVERKPAAARAKVTGALAACLALGLVAAARFREPVSFRVNRAAETPYQRLPDGQIVNHFKAEVGNEDFAPIEVDFALDEALAQAGATLVVSNHAPRLAGGDHERSDLFVKFPASLLSEGRARASILVRARREGVSEPWNASREVPLVGPLR